MIFIPGCFCCGGSSPCGLCADVFCDYQVELNEPASEQNSLDTEDPVALYCYNPVIERYNTEQSYWPGGELSGAPQLQHVLSVARATPWSVGRGVYVGQGIVETSRWRLPDGSFVDTDNPGVPEAESGAGWWLISQKRYTYQVNAQITCEGCEYQDNGGFDNCRFVLRGSMSEGVYWLFQPPSDESGGDADVWSQGFGTAYRGGWTKTAAIEQTLSSIDPVCELDECGFGENRKWRPPWQAITLSAGPSGITVSVDSVETTYQWDASTSSTCEQADAKDAWVASTCPGGAWSWASPMPSVSATYTKRPIPSGGVSTSVQWQYFAATLGETMDYLDFGQEGYPEDVGNIGRVYYYEEHAFDEADYYHCADEGGLNPRTYTKIAMAVTTDYSMEAPIVRGCGRPYAWFQVWTFFIGFYDESPQHAVAITQRMWIVRRLDGSLPYEITEQLGYRYGCGESNLHPGLNTTPAISGEWT